MPCQEEERCSEMRHISSTHVSTKQNCYSKNTLETKLYFLSKDRTQKNLENLSILCFVVYSENNREFACRYSRFLLEFRGVEKGVRIWCWGEVKSDAHVCCQISLSTRGYITFILQYMMISFQKTSGGAAFHFCANTTKDSQGKSTPHLTRMT